MGKPEEWELFGKCPDCKKVTRMRFHTDNHERDSSNDRYTCLECGENFNTGYTGEWIEEVDSLDAPYDD